MGQSNLALSVNMHCVFPQLDEEPFNPDYVEVDRVLDMSTGVDQNTGEVSQLDKQQAVFAFLC